MAHLHRLIRLLAIAVLTVISAVAQAQQQTSYQASVKYGDFSTPEDYCRDVLPRIGISSLVFTRVSPLANGVDYSCFGRVGVGGEFSFSVSLATFYCPSGGFLQGRVCIKTCPEGQELQPDGTCKPKENKCPAAGTDTGIGWFSFDGSVSIEGDICYQGCAYGIAGGVSAIGFGGKTYYVTSGPTGKTCETTSITPNTISKDDPRTDCLKKGMHFGEANGKIICVPKGDSGGGNQGGGNQGGGNQGGGNQGGGNQGGGTGGGSGGGSGDGGGGSGSGNGSGDGNGSGNGSGGGGGAGNNNKNEMEDFCAKHPDLSICKKSSYSGSGCDQPPKCEGDAVQCAIAKTVWESRCAQKKLEDENDLQKLVDSNNLGGDQALADKALNKKGDGDFDLYKEFVSSQKDYFHYSGTCPQNPEFTFKGQTYKLDISVLCSLGRFIKVLIYIFSYMLVLKLFARLGD